MCGAICRRWSGSAVWEFLADGVAPAPPHSASPQGAALKLEAVSQHMKGSNPARGKAPIETSFGWLEEV